MSTINLNYTTLDARYIKPSQVDAKIATQAAADASTYSPIASVSANALGTANNPITNPSATRPSGLTKVFWQCSTQPTNWLNGDEWINTA